MLLLPQRAEVERFRTLILQRLGLAHDDSKLESLGELLRERLMSLRDDSAASYLTRLEQPLAGREEFRVLARRLTVGETFFFRNQEQFRALMDCVLPYFIERRGGEEPRRLSILSAGCSSGEEAYSIAIALVDRLPDLGRWNIRITGIDINSAVLEKARKARYSEWSLRGTAAELRARNFTLKGTEYVLHERLRNMVVFEERNLLEADEHFWRPECFDIVFCRNATMYFPAEATQRVLARIARSMIPGGFLFLGHAETLRGISNDFHLRHTHDTFYYQRRDTLGNDEPPCAVPVEFSRETPASALVPEVTALLDNNHSWIGAIQAATDRIAVLAGERGRGGEKRPETPRPPDVKRTRLAAGADLSLALELLRQERFSEAQGQLEALPAELQGDPDVLLISAVLLTNAGKLADAERVCRRLLSLDEFNAGAHYLAALCREHANDLQGAVEHDQSAVYLSAGFAMPHLHLGLVSRRRGNGEMAREELEKARVLLRSEEASRILLFGGGFSREALIDLCNTELKSIGSSTLNAAGGGL